MMEQSNEHTTAIGTISGTFLSVFASFDTQDVVKTVVLATIGAVVSFLVSKGLKWVWGKIREN